MIDERSCTATELTLHPVSSTTCTSVNFVQRSHDERLDQSINDDDIQHLAAGPPLATSFE